jgi:RAP domain
VSRNLRVLGIANDNEVTICDTYVVDILLNASYSGRPSSKGTVIELDGPSHYEHFQLAPLGPTVMKRRHLEAAGYSVLTLPYWKWGFCDTEAKKHKILGDLLGVL